MVAGAIFGLLVGLAPSFGVLATNWVNPGSPGTSQTNQQVITGHDSAKEINDQSTANTQTSDDQNTKADTETNDDQKSSSADDHNTIVDPETNDGG